MALQAQVWRLELVDGSSHYAVLRNPGVLQTLCGQAYSHNHTRRLSSELTATACRACNETLNTNPASALKRAPHGA